MGDPTRRAGQLDALQRVVPAYKALCDHLSAAEWKVNKYEEQFGHEVYGPAWDL